MIVTVVGLTLLTLALSLTLLEGLTDLTVTPSFIIFIMLGSLIIAIFALIFKIRKSRTQTRKKGNNLAQKTNSAIGSEHVKQMESAEKENAGQKNESKGRSNYYSIGTVTRFLSRNINNDVLRSGKPENTILVVRKYQRYSFASTLAVIPLILIIIFAAQAETSHIEEITRAIEENTIEIEDPELLSEQELAELKAQTNLSVPQPVLQPIYPFLVAGLSVIPVLILFYPKIQYMGLRRSRKTIVEEELPFFSLYAAILQSVGMDLYTSFLLTIGKKVFKAMENEALLLKRNVELFARSPLEALEELARNHDSVAFKNFLLGYSSIARSGGDLSRYLENRAEEHFNLLRLRYSAYSRNVGYLVEALITVLVIVPILVVVSAFILPAATISQLIIMSAVAVPLLTIVFAVILANIQPRMFNVVGLNDVIVLAFLPLAIISFMFFTLIFGLEPWLSLAISAIIPSTINEYFTARHKRQIELIESALPNFLRDLTEYRKIGFHEVTAIIRLSKENTYNKSFDRLLRTLATLLEQGYTPTQVMRTIKIRSWFGRVTFFTLAQIAESGGGNPAVLESITGFVSSVRMTLKEAKSSVSIYSLLGYSAPLILAFTVLVINEMLGTISPEVLQGVGNESFAQLITITPLFNTTVKTFIVTSSIGTGVVIAKAVDRTFKSSGRIAIICMLAIASLLGTEYISIPGFG